jgi:asparagine synthase (glutamine-hydrolysing)
MCGICGIWNYKTAEPVECNLLATMTDTLIHCGPDDVGLHFEDEHGLGLGFRRLAIIDLSPAGVQPMSNETGSIWVVFNGEIYNFLELRLELERQGHVLRSRTDTEVILHQYEERGPDMVSDFNGMFAVAVWNNTAGTLVLARDRLGKKPLFYYDDGQRLIFGSELKAILADRQVPREMDYVALETYLTYGYVPAPLTIFTGIHRVPPGSCLVMHNGHIDIRRYWDWLPAFEPEAGCSENEGIERIRNTLRTTVRDRLISDVPLGAFLSGGVDSSAMVAMMARLSDQLVKTFSIGFQNEKCNYSRLS